MILRLATMEDAELLLRWRNDPQTRKQFFTTDIISLEPHRKWLKSALVNPAIKLWIATQAEFPIGTVRADLHDEGWDMSWTIAPEHRGRGRNTDGSACTGLS
jgi:hypothetical protein